MIFQSHLRMASHIVQAGQAVGGVSRGLLLVGSVAPDLRCVLPSHRITTTGKRFIRRLYKVKNFKSGYRRSFWMGVILHYVCDYFCLAHNSDKIKSGLGHTMYETELNRFIKEHLDNIESDAEEIICEDLKEHIDALRTASIEEVFDVLRALNREYMDLSAKISDKVKLDMAISNEIGLALMANAIFA